MTYTALHKMMQIKQSSGQQQIAVLHFKMLCISLGKFIAAYTKKEFQLHLIVY